ncbi:MAG: PilT/PilU family type 4a pilus ATPase [Kiritimatiellaeota bacterium]|nr:PilT/PilU family type 4a pilus ATPase [Kiritimatiellota bacterium]
MSKSPPKAPATDGEASAPLRIETLLEGMKTRDASDLFLEVGKPPRFRVAGQVCDSDLAVVQPAEFAAFLQSKLPQWVAEEFETARDLDLGLSLDSGDRFRLNLFYERNTPAMVARRVPTGELDFETLGLPEAVPRLADAPRGLLLITGATGSGKSTTMAAILHHINRQYPRHIVTIEDPIEFVHRDLRSLVSQREVGHDTRGFSQALRHALRQSPDVLFIGEMRDTETMQTAISAALTGHFVVSTLHTADVGQTLERIVNGYPEHLRDQVALDLSLALVGVIAQRLVPVADGSGRVPAVEILVVTPRARRLIAERRLNDIEEVIKAGGPEGMQTFNQALGDLWRRGTITVGAGCAAADNPEEFLLTVGGMDTGVESLQVPGSAASNSKFTMTKLLKAAVRNNASDLLISAGVPPMLRINGELFEVSGGVLSGEDTRRLLFSVLTPSRRAHFEEDRELDFALSLETESEDDAPPLRRRFRVNGFYQKGQISCALRIIPDRIPKPDELGLPKVLLRIAERTSGLVLVTGPTGHGKTTTLASVVDYINERRACHIITVEDPIEYVHTCQLALVEQREVYADTASFHNALKYILRQDPDVIMIGEMRDRETIAAALTAAETGHLVLATLHTNDAVQTIDRIIDVFPPHQQNQVRTQLAASLLGVFAQRLLPRRDGKGRVAAFEIMLANTAVRSLIRDQKTHQIPSAIETAAKEGMITFERALQKLHEQGIVNRQNIRAILGEITGTGLAGRTSRTH